MTDDREPFREALDPLHCQDESRHEPHWWRAEFGGPRFQCPGTKPKYEWCAALREPDGSLTLVGVAHAEDVEPDAKAHVLDHYHAWRESDQYRPRVVLVRRPVAAWEVTDAE